jgi:hypothetical protein
VCVRGSSQLEHNQNILDCNSVSYFMSKLNFWLFFVSKLNNLKLSKLSQKIESSCQRSVSPRSTVHPFLIAPELLSFPSFSCTDRIRSYSVCHFRPRHSVKQNNHHLAFSHCILHYPGPVASNWSQTSKPRKLL